MQGARPVKAGLVEPELVGQAGDYFRFIDLKVGCRRDTLRLHLA